MATGAASVPHRSPGALYWNPTDVSSPSTNYGGTHLGLLPDKVRVLHRLQIKELGSTEDGGPQPYEAKALGHLARVRATFIEWDDQVLDCAFPGMTMDDGSGGKFIAIPGVNPGARLSQYAGRLLFVPDNAGHLSFLGRAAVGYMIDEGEVALGKETKRTLEVGFILLPDPWYEDANGSQRHKTGLWGLLARLDLGVT